MVAISPLQHKRAERSLSLSERETISRGLCVGQSLRSIAKSLGRSPSTISREVKRNGGTMIIVRIKRMQRQISGLSAHKGL